MGQLELAWADTTSKMITPRWNLLCEPAGVVIPRTREDISRTVAICHRFRCPLTTISSVCVPC